MVRIARDELTELPLMSFSACSAGWGQQVLYLKIGQSDMKCWLCPRQAYFRTSILLFDYCCAWVWVGTHIPQHRHATMYACHSTRMQQHMHATAHVCQSRCIPQHTLTTEHACHSIHMSQHMHVTCLSQHMPGGRVTGQDFRNGLSPSKIGSNDWTQVTKLMWQTFHLLNQIAGLTLFWG